MSDNGWGRGWWVVGVLGLVIGCTQAGGTMRHTGASPSATETEMPTLATEERGSSSPTPRAGRAMLAQTPLRHFTTGEVLYIRHCAGCHGWEGNGTGPVGQVLLKKPPSLRRTELLTPQAEADLIARILHGRELRVALTPEAMQHTDAEVSALIAHIRRLPTMRWSEVMAGQQVYDTLCVSCHGIYGRGDGLLAPSLSPRPRDLTDPQYQQHISDAALLRIVSDGQGAMPSTVDVLDAKERRAVVAFLRLLAPGYETYDRFCAVCHGMSGIPLDVVQNELLGEVWSGAAVATKMPIFDKKYMQAHTDDYLRPRARHMLTQHRTVMPHFSGELAAEEVQQILAYLRSLPPLS